MPLLPRIRRKIKQIKNWWTAVTRSRPSPDDAEYWIIKITNLCFNIAFAMPDGIQSQSSLSHPTDLRALSGCYWVFLAMVWCQPAVSRWFADNWRRFWRAANDECKVFAIYRTYSADRYRSTTEIPCHSNSNSSIRGMCRQLRWLSTRTMQWDSRTMSTFAILERFVPNASLLPIWKWDFCRKTTFPNSRVAKQVELAVQIQTISRRVRPTWNRSRPSVALSIVASFRSVDRRPSSWCAFDSPWLCSLSRMLLTLWSHPIYCLTHLKT